MRVQVGAFHVVKRSDIHGLSKSSVLDPVLFILLNSWIKIDYILIKSSDIKREGKEIPPVSGNVEAFVAIFDVKQRYIEYSLLS